MTLANFCSVSPWLFGHGLIVLVECEQGLIKGLSLHREFPNEHINQTSRSDQGGVSDCKVTPHQTTAEEDDHGH